MHRFDLARRFPARRGSGARSSLVCCPKLPERFGKVPAAGQE